MIARKILLFLIVSATVFLATSLLMSTAFAEDNSPPANPAPTGQPTQPKTQPGDVNANLLSEAAKAFLNKDFQLVASILEEYLKKNPTSAEAYRMLGHSYYELGNMDLARKYLIKCIENGRITKDILERLAEFYSREDNHSALLSIIRMRLAIDPDNFEWNLFLADTLLQQGSKEPALAQYTDLLEKHPANTDLHVRIANVYLSKAAYDDALLHFEIAYNLGFKSDYLQDTITALLENAGDFEGALYWYAKIEKERGELTDSQKLRKADVLLSLSRHEDASSILQQLTKSADKNTTSSALLKLGKIMVYNDNYELGAKYFEQYLQIEENDTEIALFLGNYYYTRNDYRNACLHYEKVLLNSSPSRETCILFITALTNSRCQDKAKQYLATYISRFGLDSDAEEMIKTLKPE